MSGKKRGPSIADGHDSDRSNSSRHGDPESSKKRKFASGASRSDLRNGAARITGQHRGSLVWVKSDPYPWWPGVVLQKGSLNEDRTNGWKVKRLGQTDPPILNVPNFGLRHGLVGFDVDYDAMVAQGVSSGTTLPRSHTGSNQSRSHVNLPVVANRPPNHVRTSQPTKTNPAQLQAIQRVAVPHPTQPLRFGRSPSRVRLLQLLPPFLLPNPPRQRQPVWIELARTTLT
ncbi:hypothetical protein M427DRAFT_208925 [Gonapodya prolifera JEL478]|uniref:PWWP domain-containing protein n=1 Tax=Gonapodya prolifera (strain JEL478) TaxID=1344416 RepID=A0A139APF0_GONPJ|nr:hypothetical protein M427DRAFT_208925 [Gonapodya prolifera JEL478]|eukprot:KXS18365.1 hypothetical protein M427DRAFT_208925 [Gonapodya prolifera JEL478]